MIFLKRFWILVVLFPFIFSSEMDAQSSVKIRGFDSTKVDTNYFLSDWKQYTYYMEKGKKRYIRADWSPHVSCCERMKDPCDRNAEIVSVSRDWQESKLPNILAFFWVCETGRINLKLKLPDTLYTDERHRVGPEIPYEWKARKINYINKNEFIIMDWPTYENRPTFHHFVRLRKGDLK